MWQGLVGWTLVTVLVVTLANSQETSHQQENQAAKLFYEPGTDFLNIPELYHHIKAGRGGGNMTKLYLGPTFIKELESRPLSDRRLTSRFKLLDWKRRRKRLGKNTSINKLNNAVKTLRDSSESVSTGNIENSITNNGILVKEKDDRAVTPQDIWKDNRELKASAVEIDKHLKSSKDLNMEKVEKESKQNLDIDIENNRRNVGEVSESSEMDRCDEISENISELKKKIGFGNKKESSDERNSVGEDVIEGYTKMKRMAGSNGSISIYRQSKDYGDDAVPLLGWKVRSGGVFGNCLRGYDGLRNVSRTRKRIKGRSATRTRVKREDEPSTKSSTKVYHAKRANLTMNEDFTKNIATTEHYVETTRTTLATDEKDLFNQTGLIKLSKKPTEPISILTETTTKRIQEEKLNEFTSVKDELVAAGQPKAKIIISTYLANSSQQEKPVTRRYQISSDQELRNIAGCCITPPPQALLGESGSDQDTDGTVVTKPECHPKGSGPLSPMAYDPEAYGPRMEEEVEDALTGKLADRVVEVVMAKVCKCPRMMKELGLYAQGDLTKIQSSVSHPESKSACHEQTSDALKASVLQEIAQAVERLASTKSSGMCLKPPEDLCDFLMWLLSEDAEMEMPEPPACSGVAVLPRREADYLFRSAGKSEPTEELKDSDRKYNWQEWIKYLEDSPEDDNINMEGVSNEEDRIDDKGHSLKTRSIKRLYKPKRRRKRERKAGEAARRKRYTPWSLSDYP